MKIYKLNKKVLRISNGAVDFLNGLTSNDLKKTKNAFLSVHGRIIAVFDQIQIGEDQFLIVIQQEYVEILLEHLNRYIKLSRVNVEETEFNVYFDLDSQISVQNDEHCIEQRCGKFILTKHILEHNIGNQEFDLFRLKSGIPLHGKDFHDEMVLNVSVTDYVSFEKGCFLGQEPVSKVYSRSKPTWKLVVKALDDCSKDEQEKLTSKTQDLETQKEFGFVFEKNK
jgi:folate-binding protein YgfZ